MINQMIFNTELIEILELRNLIENSVCNNSSVIKIVKCGST